MQLNQKILDRFDELIRIGEPLVGQTKDITPLQQWVSSSRNLIQMVTGSDSHFSQSFTGYLGRSTVTDSAFSLGVLKAAREEYEKGYLSHLRTLIEAEVFDKFLEQAESLLRKGYYQPAAVVAGAVLEDSLRKLCTCYSDITLPDKPALDYMNGQLAKNGAYNSLTQKKITALADIRNSAAHGKWTEFDKDDVKKMVLEVRDFLEKYFST